jgi:DNA-binding MarR family transcriptional regulator
MLKQYYRQQDYQARKSIGYLLRRGRNMLTSQVETLFKEKLGPGGIPYVQWVILMCLRDSLARTPSELSQYICHDSGALTRVLDQMEERGIITRERSHEDRRVVDLALTPEGIRTVESHIGIIVDYYNELLADFSREEVDTLLRLLTRVVDKLDSTRSGG